MSVRLLIDNWTLQSCRELLSEGLTGETTSELIISPADGETLYQEVSADAVRVQSLFQTLNDAIFADELFVDADFARVWDQSSALQPLSESRLVVRKPFRAVKTEWIDIREELAAELCGSDEVRQRHAENVASYKLTGKAADPFLSQLVWGGAGMLARADFLKVPYSPHPSRGRLLKQSGYIQAQSGAQEQLLSFIQSERAKVYATAHSKGITGTIVLPPAIVRVFQDASDVAQLFQIAIEIRSEYRRLREWIIDFQRVLDAEDGRELMSRKKTLRSVADRLAALSAPSKFGETSLQFGVGFPKLSTKLGSPVNAIANAFGIRAQIKNLVLTESGQTAFRHLLKLLGEERSARGRAVEREFMR